MPSIFSGLRIALPVAIIVVVITEMIGDSVGLGYYITIWSTRFTFANVYAAIIVIGICGSRARSGFAPAAAPTGLLAAGRGVRMHIGRMTAERIQERAGYTGQPLRRRARIGRLLRGMGRFVDDVILPGTAWCAFVRSPQAHARIRSISTKPAAARPGVLLTLTAQDWSDAGHGELTVVHPMPFGDGRPMNCAPRPAFAREKVHHVGDIVAAVLAESRFAAEDAAEAVQVDDDPLPAVATTRNAVAPGAPLVHEQFGTNLVFEIERGDRAKAETAMAAAAKVVALHLKNNRLSANPIEPRSYLCDYDSANDRYTLYATVQQPHYLRRWLSVYTLHIPEHKIRVISPDVGGGFASRETSRPKCLRSFGLLKSCAGRQIGRPHEPRASSPMRKRAITIPSLAWVSTAKAELLQCRSTLLPHWGAISATLRPAFPAIPIRRPSPASTRTPNLHLRVRGVYTNTIPVDAYRGSGRPEATWTNERLLELGARELGIDAVEIRRRNLITRADFPYSAPGGRLYNFGDPPALLDRLLQLADYAALREQQEELRKKGALMGIGLAAFIDKAGTGPSGNLAKRVAGMAAGKAPSFECTATAR